MKGRESVRKEQEVVVDHVEWQQLGLRRDQKGLVKAWLDRRVRDGTTEGSNEREMDVRNEIISEETCLLCTVTGQRNTNMMLSIAMIVPLNDF